MKINECPHCKGLLRIKKKKCQNCGLNLEADFDENPMMMLPRKEQDFLLDFILCGGNFKALGEKLGLTYPTLRSHLDRIIDQLKDFQKTMSTEGILDALDRGELSPEQGIERLKKIKGGMNE